MPGCCLATLCSSPWPPNLSKDVFKDDVTVKHYAVRRGGSTVGFSHFRWYPYRGMVIHHFHQGEDTYLFFFWDSIIFGAYHLWACLWKTPWMFLFADDLSIFPTLIAINWGIPPFLETPVVKKSGSGTRRWFGVSWTSAGTITHQGLSNGVLVFHHFPSEDDNLR